jgi:hypothetical protein
MICPLCGSTAYRHQISRRMAVIARRPRPSIRGTLAAKERARKAALARWRRARVATDESQSQTDL